MVNVATAPKKRTWAMQGRAARLVLMGLVVWMGAYSVRVYTRFNNLESAQVRVPPNAKQILDVCAALNIPAGPPPGFDERKASDRFEPGTPPTLIRNATIFTGAFNGTEIAYGDLFLDKGIVKALGFVPPILLKHASRDGNQLQTIDANGAWVTPGLVDLHSHIGLLSAPLLGGAFDVNSRHGPILPWLRSIDGFNTHDEAMTLAIAGGVTSIQALPGSGNAIGGQAFMLKLAKTKELSPASMIIEPPHTLNGSAPIDRNHPPRWRHMKQACGENLRRYGTRMDTAWAFRQAYNEARKIRDAQDTYCTHARAGTWSTIVDQKFPDSLQWEMLVDVLRGRVKISNHCYEPVDLDNIVRLTNEFKFPIAAFHHASGAYLVPEVLKKTWGGVPAIAIFATNHRYKRESYRGSEFAPRILADNDIPVVMKTDHPVINGRDILFEAQQAHYFGLPAHLALASVTSVPATAAGMSHRIGILRTGSDADIVLWDSHPLRLGATPRRVWIDGKAQIPVQNQQPIEVGKGKEGIDWQIPPNPPDWDRETRETVDWEGLPPLGPGHKLDGKVVFKRVKEVWLRSESGIKNHLSLNISRTDLESVDPEQLITAVVYSGRLVCAENGPKACWDHIGRDVQIMDLAGGSIVPALMSYGSPLGLEEIAGERSTGDGPIINPLLKDAPKILGDVGAVVRAVDGLHFATRNALTAHRSGVTLATSTLGKTTLFAGTNAVFTGLSVTFRTGAANALEKNAILKSATALHVSIGRAAPFVGSVGTASVSTQIATLRRLLLSTEIEDTETGHWFHKASKGIIPIVIDVGSADIMATLLKVKAEVEEARGPHIRMVFARATEAHLIAKNIAKANVGVILIGSRQFPETWDDRRILPGPPLSNDTALAALLEAGVTVGVGVREAWSARNTYFDIAWASLASNGRIQREQALELSSINLEKLLGIHVEPEQADLVAFAGGSAWNFEGRPVAIISPHMRTAEIL